MKEFRYGTGCNPSVLDGTEHVFNSTKMEVPEEMSYISVMPPVRNQGNTSKCVCFSLTAYLDWRKNLDEGDNNGCQFDVDALYSIRENKSAEGMQIKEALHYLRHTGLNGMKIGEYAKVGGIEAAKRALIVNGPLEVGIPVYSDNINADCWKGNRMVGGHAVEFVGYNKDGFVLRNSWGTEWSDNGYRLFPYSDFEQVFEIWTVN